MIQFFFLCKLDPRDAAYYICAKIQGIFDQFLCSWFSCNTILWECNYLDIQTVLIFLSSADNSFHAFQSCFAVYISKCTDMGIAIFNSQIAGLADIFNDPFFIIAGLKICCSFNGSHCSAHVVVIIFLQSVLTCHFQCIYLAQMKMAVYKGFCYQFSFCINDLLCFTFYRWRNGCDLSIFNSDLYQFFSCFSCFRICDLNIQHM